MLEGLLLLLRRRYQVHTATSGPAGLAVLEQVPDILVVVSDMQMPGMDGARFLKLVRERDPTSVAFSSPVSLTSIPPLTR